MSGHLLLKRYLKVSGYTQRALAESAGLHESQISVWLKGERGPDISSAVALAEATANAVPVECWAKKKLVTAPRTRKGTRVQRRAIP